MPRMNINWKKVMEEAEQLPPQKQGDPGLIVYDEETREFVQVTKQDIKAWVKEAVKESMPPSE